MITKRLVLELHCAGRGVGESKAFQTLSFTSRYGSALDRHQRDAGEKAFRFRHGRELDEQALRTGHMIMQSTLTLDPFLYHTYIHTYILAAMIMTHVNMTCLLGSIFNLHPHPGSYA